MFRDHSTQRFAARAALEALSEYFYTQRLDEFSGANGISWVTEKLRHERRTVHYRGHVQGVGFRYSVQSIVQPFAVTGYVQNLSDGRVRLVAEGATADLDGFLKDVEQRLRQYIYGTDVVVAQASGEFDDFVIKS